MFLVAFLAVYWSVAGWHEGYFSLLSTVCANCFVHLSWSSETASPFSEAAFSFVAHIISSVCFFSDAIANSALPLNLDRYPVSNLRAKHENHKPRCLKWIQARAGTKSIVIPRTALPVFGFSISF